MHYFLSTILVTQFGCDKFWKTLLNINASPLHSLTIHPTSIVQIILFYGKVQKNCSFRASLGPPVTRTTTEHWKILSNTIRADSRSTYSMCRSATKKAMPRSRSEYIYIHNSVYLYEHNHSELPFGSFECMQWQLPVCQLNLNRGENGWKQKKNHVHILNVMRSFFRSLRTKTIETRYATYMNAGGIQRRKKCNAHAQRTLSFVILVVGCVARVSPLYTSTKSTNFCPYRDERIK